MSDSTIKERMDKIKKMIEVLINDGNLEEAKKNISEYEEVVKSDIDIYSMKAVISIMENNYDEALDILLLGYVIDDTNFDILYNLGYINELLGNFNESIRYYKESQNSVQDDNIIQQINEIIDKIKLDNKDKINENREKLVFFVKEGMDSFLGDIIKGLSEDYETRKVIVNNYIQIDEGMQWADVCWFEWCDELVGYGSKLIIAEKKKIVCRIHGYEVYTDLINHVNWINIDDLIIVAPHIRRIFEENVKDINIEKLRIHTVFCGINLDKYPLNIKRKGFNLGYLGYINFKKNIPLTLDIFKKLYDIDNRYKLYLAGEFQDARTLAYINYFIKEYKLYDNVFFDGWQNEQQKIQWLKKIDYMIISSIDEGLCFAAAESMCSGIKPILHNCEGIKDHYNKSYIFNTIDEAVEMIKADSYDSVKYRNFIKDNYSLEKQIRIIKILINKLVLKSNMDLSKDESLVTIGVVNYNNIKYLDDCIQSILNQNYKNVEILIIDDCSNDGCISKIQEYEKIYNNIRGIYHKKNTGNGSYACKDTIENSKGEYFLFIASDDYFPDSNVIKDYINVFKHNDVDYVYGNLAIVNSNRDLINRWCYQQLKNDEIVRETFVKKGSGVLTMTGMFKKAFYDRNDIKWIVPEVNKVAPDTLNSLILIKNNPNIYHMNRDVLCYRQHNTNGTLNYKERVKSIVSVMEYIINNFPEEEYLFEGQWEDIDIVMKKCTKMFLIGEKYYELFIFYFEQWRPFGREVTLSKAEKIVCLKPVIKKINYYFSNSKKCSNYYDDYIENMQKRINFYVKGVNNYEE